MEVLFLLLIGWSIWRTMEKRKTDKKQAEARARGFADATASTVGDPPSQDRKSGAGSLTGESMEGRDPCHDDWAAMPSGSLHVNSPEGVDPCHDDWAAMPSGSLHVNSPEGTDPCHDGWGPLRAGTEPEREPDAASGLPLSWTGNDLVKGFVYSEILQRK